MKKVPPEIDRLMWAVAENPNPQALDEFGTRYPDYRGELLKRVEMVRGLRQEVKGSGLNKREIPKFEPKPIQPPGAPRGAMVAFCFAVVAIAFAGYTAISARRPTQPKLDAVEHQLEAPLPIPKVVMSEGFGQSVPPPRTPPIVRESSPTLESTPVALEDKKRDLTLKGVDLVQGLSLITTGTHLKLEIGPGFVNQKVSLTFHDKTTREMLAQMAKDYAFTISDEGDGLILVVPAPDSGPDTDASLNDQKRIGP